MSDLDRPESFILSITPAPPARPMIVLSTWRDEEGWWHGWAEPVLYVALVERRWYTVGRTIRQTERVLDPVVYDVNALGRLSTFDEMLDGARLTSNDYLDIHPADVDWQTVVEQIRAAEAELDHRQRDRERA